MKKIDWSKLAFVIMIGPLYHGPNPDLSQYPQWQRVVAEAKYTPPKQEFHGDLKKLLDQEQAKYKNVPYITDKKNYGVEDYWATREEMKVHGGGECHDYAIAKYYDLLEAGIPDREMAILFVATKNKDNHVILKVDNWYLDSLYPNTIYSEKIFEQNYALVYSVNRLGFYRNIFETMPR